MGKYQNYKLLTLAPSRGIRRRRWIWVVLGILALVTFHIWKGKEILPAATRYIHVPMSSVKGTDTLSPDPLPNRVFSPEIDALPQTDAISSGDRARRPKISPGMATKKQDAETEIDVEEKGPMDMDDNDSEQEESQGETWTEMQEEGTASTGESAKFPRFGKITASFEDPDHVYEAAIASHRRHGGMHGYKHFVLRERMIGGLWSKHMWIMTVIGRELAKPRGQRLEWLMWHDRDTFIMNPQIPLDIFVPPEPAFRHVHLVVTEDRNGLNNGVFLVRVHPWAFKMFASALSLREYQPEIPLRYTEQSAMEVTIKRPQWSKAVTFVPQRWFNGYPPQNPNTTTTAAHSRLGSLLIHFASNRDGKRLERIEHWESIAASADSPWNKPANETHYLEEIAEYWERLAQGEAVRNVCEDIGKRTWV